MQFLRLTATSISEKQKCAEVGTDKRYAFFNPYQSFLFFDDKVVVVVSVVVDVVVVSQLD